MKRGNPFSRYQTIDDNNYLKINVRLLRDENLPDSFNRAIDTLVEIRKTLSIIERLGRLHESGSRVYYMQAIQWLKGDLALSNLVSVPQLVDLDSLGENTANDFERYTQDLLSHLRGEQVYSQVEIVAAVARATTAKDIEKAADEAMSSVENKAAEIESVTKEGMSSLGSETLNTIHQEADLLREELRSIVSGNIDTINRESSNAISQLQQAQSLEKWGASYAQTIEEYSRKLEGIKWAEGTLERNLVSLGRHIKKIKWSWHVNYKNLWLLPYVVGCILYKNISKVIKVVISKLASYKLQRTFWFILIICFALAFVLTALMVLFPGVEKILGYDFSNLRNSMPVSQWYEKLVVYVPIAVILGIGYSFAVKNYRIYSNMLDQYMHRKTVAETSQGIILSLNASENKDIQNQITAAAAQALFEHRVTGHLSKKEAESLSVVDLFRTLRGG